MYNEIFNSAIANGESARLAEKALPETSRTKYNGTLEVANPNAKNPLDRFMFKSEGGNGYFKMLLVQLSSGRGAQSKAYTKVIFEDSFFGKEFVADLTSEEGELIDRESGKTDTIWFGVYVRVPFNGMYKVTFSYNKKDYTAEQDGRDTFLFLDESVNAESQRTIRGIERRIAENTGEYELVASYKINDDVAAKEKALQDKLNEINP
jgi:hypothetical protein